MRLKPQPLSGDLARVTLSILSAALLLFALPCRAAKNDWAEGTADRNDGATRDYYNRGARLAWQHFMGDWRDADDKPQGDRPFASSALSRESIGTWVEWDVTLLVQRWLAGRHQNQGFFLRWLGGAGPILFCSREYPQESLSPQLVLATDERPIVLHPVADTHLEPSTYRSQGTSEQLRIGRNNPVLLRFSLPAPSLLGSLANATLRLHVSGAYGSGTTTIGVFRCQQGQAEVTAEPALGLAARYPGDRQIESDPEVIFAATFEEDDWADRWTHAGEPNAIETVASDDRLRFEPLQGRALRVLIAKGKTGALNTLFKFSRETGTEPEQIYFRYYVRLASDWNQTLQGGKMPGISGTYGIAGWGGRKSHGTDGWSARGSYAMTIPAGNPLGGTTPIGTYCYHADMKGTYGDVWLWQQGYRGYLENNRWYCVEQYLKLNTPGQHDGVLRAWIDGRPAFEKRDICFRLVDRLKIEQIWMNVYHGGKLPSPRDQHLYIDNVVVARTYIGPMAK